MYAKAVHHILMYLLNHSLHSHPISNLTMFAAASAVLALALPVIASPTPTTPTAHTRFRRAGVTGCTCYGQTAPGSSDVSTTKPISGPNFPASLLRIFGQRRRMVL